MKKPVKYVLLTLFGCVLSLLLLEGGLQVAAFLVTQAAESRGAPSAPRGAGEKVVLCVGDSFTFGVGASDASRSYPGMLQQHLNESPAGEAGAAAAWRVVNGGWPGRNSAELLQRMPRFLTDERPDYVCVLVGKNNRWSRDEMDLPPPALAEGSGESRGFQWRLRTLRLLQTLWANLGEPDAGSAQPRAKQDDPQARKEGSRSGQKSPLLIPEAQQTPEFRALKDAGRKLQKGDRAFAERAAAEMRERVRALDDLPTEMQYVMLLVGLSRQEELIDECFFASEKYGKSAELCALVIFPLAQLGRFDEALSWADEAFRLRGPGEPKPYAHRARVYRKMGRTVDALRDTIQAFAQDRDRTYLEKELVKLYMRDAAVHEQLEEMAGPLGLAQEDLETLRAVAAAAHAQLLAERAGPEDSDTRVRLEQDLRHFVSLVRQSGAQPLLLTYPRNLGPIQQGLRTVAEDEGALLVDLEPVFAELLETAAEEDYFIADGHCNDAGYAVMARAVAAAIRGR
ncbi:MAG: hypothetical protein HY812_06765 [Planctomycetes bacterium]|nr:hypothetical protein [Planctomycetota bacterium]